MKFPLLCCLCAVVVTPAFAGANSESSARVTTTSTTVESVAERELARREESISRAHDLIEAGDKAMAEHDYETAFSSYKAVCDMLTESDATHRLRARACNGLCEAACNLAEQRIGEGRFADAETIAKSVLDEKYDPHCHRATIILAHLEDPEYYNKTITPKFRGNVEQVKQLFKEADGFFATGRFDMAFKRYEQVLNLDPYNIAARKGEEKVNKARDDYAIQGYSHTRSYMNWQVDKAWDRPVRRFGLKEGAIIESQRTDVRGTEYINNKLGRIVIPKIEFREATVREAIDFLKQKSRELDTEPDPTKRGVNIVLKLESSGSAPAAGAAPAEPAVPAAPAIPGLEQPAAPAAGAAAAAPAINPADVRITLSLTNIPLLEALRYITNLASLKIKIDPYAVAIVPITENTEALVTKEYKVRPGFISNAPGGGAAGNALNAGATRAGAGGGGGANDTTRGGQGIATRAGAKEFLESQGVQFPQGASANYLASSSRLVVRNTQENLDLVDTLVDADIVSAPSQVEIESKFVEITQQNLKELSFDVLVGQGNIPGSNKVFFSGGTTGTGTAPAATDFPLGFPTSGSLVEQPLTSSLRSGNLAISANAIDALLFPTGGLSKLAPGILGVGSVLTDPTFQVVLRALNQKKGVDLLSAPRVTTKSGQRAVIEIIREFRYPTEFDPPQIPQTFSPPTTSSAIGSTSASSGAFPVTPTTPTAFETRNTGVTLEVEPTVGPDGYTIDLNLVPQVVEFEGFINYGSPIKTVSPASLLAGGGSTSVTLTDNVINQPIFSTRKVTTSVSIWDGQTVVLGGLMREDVQKVEDKVPILGDIPIIGRAFRSSVDQHLKRNLIIFVSARLINPAGEPIQQDDEKEEVVEQIGLPQPPPAAPQPEMPLFQK